MSFVFTGFSGQFRPSSTCPACRLLFENCRTEATSSGGQTVGSLDIYLNRVLAVSLLSVRPRCLGHIPIAIDTLSIGGPLLPIQPPLFFERRALSNVSNVHPPANSSANAMYVSTHDPNAQGRLFMAFPFGYQWVLFPTMIMVMTTVCYILRAIIARRVALARKTNELCTGRITGERNSVIVARSFPYNLQQFRSV